MIALQLRTPATTHHGYLSAPEAGGQPDCPRAFEENSRMVLPCIPAHVGPDSRRRPACNSETTDKPGDATGKRVPALQ